MGEIPHSRRRLIETIGKSRHRRLPQFLVEACDGVWILQQKKQSSAEIQVRRTTSLAVREVMVRPGGFEPPTLCFGGTRSIHLSYGRIRERIEDKFTLLYHGGKINPFTMQRGDAAR
jgi:hypothetical protein